MLFHILSWRIKSLEQHFQMLWKIKICCSMLVIIILKKEITEASTWMVNALIFSLLLRHHRSMKTIRCWITKYCKSIIMFIFSTMMIDILMGSETVQRWECEIAQCIQFTTPIENKWVCAKWPVDLFTHFLLSLN